VFNKKTNLENLVKFLLNIFFLYFLNICMFFVCIEIFTFDVIISQFCIMVMLVLINFIIKKNNLKVYVNEIIYSNNTL
jgi:hypothetical protein